MIEAQPQQSKEGEFAEMQYREGQIFSRKNAFDNDLGFSTYSGEYYVNCDGVVMKFNDGKQVLSDFCEVVTFDCPNALWAVTKDIEAIEKSAKEKIEKILQEYKEINEGEKMTRLVLKHTKSF